MRVIAFRCDGGPRIGAGHVARCLQIALAFRGGGDEVVFAGDFEGVARQLLIDAEVEIRRTVTGGADAVVVDSYDMPGSEFNSLVQSLPVVAITDGGPVPEATLALDYHPDAEAAQLAGTDYAPVSPRFVAARRARGFERGLVTVGGGEAGGAVREAAAAALRAQGLEVIEPGGGAGLHAEVRRADVALSAAGVTAYELACAGVPTGLVPLAPNQERVARAFAERGLAVAGDHPASLAGALADAPRRAAIAHTGPAAVDGYGAFRVRDAVRAAFVGAPLPPVLRYRSARAEDRESQLAWRNDLESRAASWDQRVVDPAEHAAWFEAVLSDPDRVLIMIDTDAGRAGSVRFDADGEEAEISVMVSPALRGGGVGKRAIRESSELYLAAHPEIARVRAEIREDNPRSGTVFGHAGYRRALRRSPEGHPVFTLDRTALASSPS